MGNTSSSSYAAAEPYIVAYYALLLMIFGTSMNILTFIIFFRGKFRDTNERPTIHYMRAIAIVDIFMLYGWNLDHYLSNVYGYTFESTSIAACKITLFINYFAPQVSAWLRVFICVDRYMSLSRLHRTWFGKSKNALIIITTVVVFFTALNLHLVILGCFYDSTGQITGNTDTYHIIPLWDWVNLGLYNGIPFILMSTLNTGVIYHLMQLKKNSTVQNSQRRHRAISITLVITTFLFMFLTIPTTICYGFFVSDISSVVLDALDALMYTYHVSAFPLYLITFTEFRLEFLSMISCRKAQQRVGPILMTTKMTAHQ